MALSGVEALAVLPPHQEVFPGLTAGDLCWAMTPQTTAPLRSGTATYLPGGTDLQGLHWYAPPGVGPHPAVLFVHSGSWAGGDATMYLRYASELAARGFVTASLNHRLAPAARWPAALDDVCAAIAWLLADPLDLGVDPAALALAGGSSGAHLAAMAAVGQGASTAADGVAALVLWYPPLRLATMAAVPEAAPAVEALLGGLDARALDVASPLTHAAALAAPVLTMTGDRDPICPPADARAFHAALERAGVDNELVVVRDAPHGFDFTRRWYDLSFAHLAEFLDAHLKRCTAAPDRRS